jgi:hypothetical protein
MGRLTETLLWRLDSSTRTCSQARPRGASDRTGAATVKAKTPANPNVRTLMSTSKPCPCLPNVQARRKVLLFVASTVFKELDANYDEKLRATDARPFFEQAAAKDPTFALAPVDLANTATSGARPRRW